jgi:hypothetical protein
VSSDSDSDLVKKLVQNLEVILVILQKLEFEVILVILVKCTLTFLSTFSLENYHHNKKIFVKLCSNLKKVYIWIIIVVKPGGFNS